jgi:hypothetical protein
MRRRAGYADRTQDAEMQRRRNSVVLGSPGMQDARRQAGSQQGSRPCNQRAMQFCVDSLGCDLSRVTCVFQALNRHGPVDDAAPASALRAMATR